MRGDVSILDGKLCYEFDISPDIANAMQNKKGRFFKGTDEWVIHKIDHDKKVAFCYQPMVTTQTSNIKRLQDRMTMLQAEIEYLDDQHRALLTKYKWKHAPLTVKINRLVCMLKMRINQVTWKIFKKDVFSNFYCEGIAIKTSSIPRRV